MGKQISNSSILLTSAIPLDARSHFITYQEAAAALADKQGVSVARSSQDATVTSGVYQNYYYGQIITTEKHGTFTVVANSDYSAYKAALEKEWGDNDNVIYSYDSSSKTITIEVKCSGTYVKAHKEDIIIITPTTNIDLSEKILPFYSFFGTEKPVLKSVISIVNGALFINPKGQFIDDNFKPSSHLQPFSGSGGGGGGSSIAGAKTQDDTILQIVNNYLQDGNFDSNVTLGKKTFSVGSDVRYGSTELLLPWSSNGGTTWKYSSIKAEAGNGWHNVVFTVDTSGSELGALYIDGNLSVSGILNIDGDRIKVNWNAVSSGVELTFPTKVGTLALTSDVSDAQLSAVEEANTYTDENLNNYYNKTSVNNVFAEGPYKFVKVLDNGIVNTPLTPDINIGIVESSVSATVTYKAVLWKNSIDNTYKITMDIKSTSMTSCTLKPKPLKIALVSYASTWRVPTVYMKNICANAMSQMSKWGVANCWVSNLSGRCLRDETTNIGKLNANGLEQVIVNGMDNTNICLALILAEFDTDHVSDNLPIKGFSYHVELLTSKTTL